MTQLFIIFFNLLVVCLGRHVWQLVKKVYQTKGVGIGLSAGAFSSVLLFSGTAAANTFILQIAELSQAAP